MSSQGLSKCRSPFASSLLICFIVLPSARVVEGSEIPTNAPQDAVMASPQEIQGITGWANLAFSGLSLPRLTEMLSGRIAEFGIERAADNEG